MSEDSYYVKNVDLLKEIVILKETGEFTNQLGKYIIKIVNGLSHRPNFCGYTYIDDMRSEAILSIVKGIKNFDLEKYSNPFAYITQIAWNAFVFFINKEKKKSKVKGRIFDLKDSFEKEFYELKAVDYSTMCNVIIKDLDLPVEE